MKTIALTACALWLHVFASSAVSETNPTITSFNHGILEWKNVDTQLYYNVQWKCSLSSSNDWTSRFRGCQDIRSTNDTLAVAIPMFYRISGTGNPVNTQSLSPSNTLVEAGYYESASLAQVDTDLIPVNIKKDVDIFGVTGTFEGTGGAYPAPVPRTGQTDSWRSGDDGDLEPGVGWPNPRFTIDAANWTVTDNLTGLMWRRIANLSGTVTWDAAIDNCNALDEGGYSDWRLPTLRELMSLIDVRYLMPALGNTTGTAQWTSPNPFYSVQTSGKYWTSTTRAGISSQKWYVDMYYGIPGFASGTVSYYYVWPVRNAD